MFAPGFDLQAARQYSRRRAMPVGLLAAALLLLLAGLFAMNPAEADTARFLAGDPPYDATWILSAGIVATGMAFGNLYHGDK